MFYLERKSVGPLYIIMLQKQSRITLCMFNSQAFHILCSYEDSGLDGSLLRTLSHRVLQGLFRNFDDAFLPVLQPHLEQLVADSHESTQRCLAEIIAGLIRGSKHWTFEKVLKQYFLSDSWKSRKKFELLNKFDVLIWGDVMCCLCPRKDRKMLQCSVSLPNSEPSP